MDTPTTLTIWLIVATGACAIAAVIAPIISWRLSRSHQQRFLADITPEARALVQDGSWQGTSTLDIGPPEYQGEYAVHLQLAVEDGKVMSGEFIYWVDPNNPKSPKEHIPKATMDTRGGFNDERFLTFRLKPKNPNDVHFGIQIFELAADRRQMNGIWIAFGFHAGQFIGGSIKLVRI